MKVEIQQLLTNDQYEDYPKPKNINDIYFKFILTKYFPFTIRIESATSG